MRLRGPTRERQHRRNAQWGAYFERAAHLVAWVASPGQKTALKKLILVKNKNKNMLERARARSISKDYLKAAFYYVIRGWDRGVWPH